MHPFFWQKHQETSPQEAREMLAGSHAEVMQWTHCFTNEELFLSKAFPDLDGTLLRSNEKISDFIISVINDLTERGMFFPMQLLGL